MWSCPSHCISKANMKKLLLLLLAVTAFRVSAVTFTATNSFVLYSNAISGYLLGSGDGIQWVFTGSNGPSFQDAQLTLALNETNLISVDTPEGASWTNSGSLSIAGTNVIALVNYSDSTGTNVGYTLVLTNLSLSSEAIWLYWSEGYDPAGPVYLGKSLLLGNNIPIYDPYGAAFWATNGWPWMVNVSNIVSGSVTVTNTLTGAPGSAPTVTNLGSGIVAVLQFTFPPAGSGGSADNAVLSSQQFYWFATNAFVFSGTSNFITIASNYFGSTIETPLYVSGSSPGGFGSIMSASPYLLSGSYDGSTWFAITNGFSTTNQISLSIICTNAGVGAIAIYGMDHPELNGRTNSTFNQVWITADPVTPTDPVNKRYVDTLNQINASTTWSSYQTNGFTHLRFNALGQTVQDISYGFTIAPISPASIDATGTNITFRTSTTNLLTGWQLLTTTNLCLPFTSTTAYSTNVSAGVCTFTIPVIPGLQAAFYAVAPIVSTINNLYGTVRANTGVFYPSNTWSIFAATNGMANGDWAIRNSNGVAMVAVGLSNGIVKFKQLAP